MIHRTLSDLPDEGVSHDPAIRKRTLLRKGELGPLCMFAQSRFEPGQCCAEHAHESMDEVFFVENGRGLIVVDGREVALIPGVCVVVEAGERHALRNDGEETLVLTYFGLQRGDG